MAPDLHTQHTHIQTNPALNIAHECEQEDKRNKYPATIYSTTMVYGGTQHIQNTPLEANKNRCRLCSHQILLQKSVDFMHVFVVHINNNNKLYLICSKAGWRGICASSDNIALRSTTNNNVSVSATASSVLSAEDKEAGIRK